MVYFDKKEVAAKIESIEGSAFVDFPVNKTVIYPDYRNNTRELGKIRATIDTVYNDKDVTITGVWLKGYASPESPYSHNRDLAIGRTAALKGYINRLYNFNEGIITTAYEPEDWEGLRKFVENSNLEHKYDILAIIDSDMAPDPKEAKIKREFPTEYRFMLENYYPALRHTDYKITYEIARFTDIDKIREVMRTKPGHLSLEEFYLLGNNCQPGTDEFNEVFETAVRMFPDDPTANINAANAAIQRRDFVSAEKYLSRAGDSPEAIYARGALAFAMGHNERAKELLSEVSSMPQAKTILEDIEKAEASKTVRTSSFTLD